MTSDGAAYFPETLVGQSDVALPEPSSPSVDNPESRELPSVPKQHAHQSDEVLLAEAGNGSKDALGLLFRRYRRTVLSVAQRILKDPAEAEDLCQEAFLLLFQKGKLFDASKGTAASWIIQITYHRAMNRRQYLTFRQHYNAQELDEEQISGSRQSPLIDEIVARSLLDRVREQLSPDQRQTLELHFFEGYSLREIAEKTNQTLGNIRHHFYRGLDRLRSTVFPQKDA